MPNTQRSMLRTQRLNFWLLCALFAVLWVAGGSARADALGQAVVRFTAFSVLAAHFLFAAKLRPDGTGAPLKIVLAMVGVVAIQLIPLPPALWTPLPGREVFVAAAELLGLPQPWRPLSISPSWTVNALQSLAIPLVVLWLARDIEREDQWLILALFIGLILAGALLGLLQLGGASVDNPFINENAGFVSGNFANRNHFALSTALACLFLPIWALRNGGGWRVIAAVVLLPLFILVNLSTGSRSGLVLSAIAIAAGVFAVRMEAVAAYRKLPRKWSRSIAVGALLLVVLLVASSIFLGRAESVNRAFSLDASQDLRAQSRPVVVALAARYFPVGSGFGTFDSAYRMVEPDSLLAMTYLNHAHNDWLEVVLDGGILAVLLLLAALYWWLKASWREWRGARRPDLLARAGSVAIFIILVASLTDYPARTPMMMAILALAAHWLEQGAQRPNNQRAAKASRASNSADAASRPDAAPNL